MENNIVFLHVKMHVKTIQAYFVNYISKKE